MWLGPRIRSRVWLDRAEEHTRETEARGRSRPPGPRAAAGLSAWLGRSGVRRRAGRSRREPRAHGRCSGPRGASGKARPQAPARRARPPVENGPARPGPARRRRRAKDGHQQFSSPHSTPVTLLARLPHHPLSSDTTGVVLCSVQC
ncbi:unnamed protein product [Natator depressus]